MADAEGQAEAQPQVHCPELEWLGIWTTALCLLSDTYWRLQLVCSKLRDCLLRLRSCLLVTVTLPSAALLTPWKLLCKGLLCTLLQANSTAGADAQTEQKAETAAPQTEVVKKRRTKKTNVAHQAETGGLPQQQLQVSCRDETICQR